MRKEWFDRLLDKLQSAVDEADSEDEMALMCMISMTIGNIIKTENP